MWIDLPYDALLVLKSARPDLAEYSDDVLRPRTNRERYYDITAQLELARDDSLVVETSPVIRQKLKGAWVQCWCWVDQPGPYDQWLTHCPICFAELYVTQATLESTGEVLRMHSPLHATGFDVPTDQRDASTRDEVVTCFECNATYTLNDLAID